MTRAREEEKAKMQEEAERIRAQARAKMEQMRAQFEQARGVGSQGTSHSLEDDLGKTIQDAEMTGVTNDGKDEV